MHQPNNRVLLVEDDNKLASLIQKFLSDQGFDVNIESSGDLAVERIFH
jgi:two-component system, OmpR family, response regulator RstA